MSNSNRRDRGALIALALALLAISFCVWISQPAYSQKTGQTDQETDAKIGEDGHVETVYFGLFKPADTVAQWMVALLSFVATGVSAWAVILVRSTLNETREAVAVTRRIGEAQLRAYVHITDIAFVESDDEFVPTVTITYRNFGQTPAYNLTNNVTASLVIAGNPKPFGHDHTSERKMNIGPGQEVSTTINVALQGMLTENMLSTKVAALFVHGTIAYEDAFKTERITKFKTRLHVAGKKICNADIFVICDDGNDAN